MCQLLLKIIEHQQEVFFVQVFFEAILQRLAACFPESKGLRNRENDEGRIVDVSQGDKVNSARKCIQHFGCHLQRQARFADAARSNKGEQPHASLPEQPTGSGNVLLASEQRWELRREVGCHGAGCIG